MCCKQEKILEKLINNSCNVICTQYDLPVVYITWSNTAPYCRIDVQIDLSTNRLYSSPGHVQAGSTRASIVSRGWNNHNHWNHRQQQTQVCLHIAVIHAHVPGQEKHCEVTITAWNQCIPVMWDLYSCLRKLQVFQSLT